eukprot:2760984-Amphidinium_carterae.2
MACNVSCSQSSPANGVVGAPDVGVAVLELFVGRKETPPAMPGSQNHDPKSTGLISRITQNHGVLRRSS